MAARESDYSQTPLDSQSGSGVPPRLREALAEVGESDRFRFLATLLAEWADQSANGQAGSSEEVEALTRKTQSLSEEKASLQDKVATLQADLDHRNKQLEAEQTRGHELGLLQEEQRARLEGLQTSVTDLEAQLVTRNHDLHKAQVENENLQLQLQRGELASTDQSGQDRADASNRQLSKEVETLRADLVQLREDKDAQIGRLASELGNASSSGRTTEVPFAAVWDRLAMAKPPLIDPTMAPTVQCAERMADALAELVRFVDDFDKLIRPFLSKYTKFNPRLKVPWEVYARGDDVRTKVMQALVPVGGKPIGIVKVRLRGLYRWTEGAMIGCDATIESLGDSLFAFLTGPTGNESDPNLTVKRFLQQDGHELFLQRVRQLRGERLAAAFSRSS